LLLFQALDKRDKPLQPDSLIDYSISYFLSENDDAHLAACYFTKEINANAPNILMKLLHFT